MWRRLDHLIILCIFHSLGSSSYKKQVYHQFRKPCSRQSNSIFSHNRKVISRLGIKQNVQSIKLSWWECVLHIRKKQKGRDGKRIKGRKRKMERGMKDWKVKWEGKDKKRKGKESTGIISLDASESQILVLLYANGRGHTKHTCKKWMSMTQWKESRGWFSRIKPTGEGGKWPFIDRKEERQNPNKN